MVFLLRTFLIERKNFLSENLEIKVEVIIPLFPVEMQRVWNTCIPSIFLSRFQMACISIEKYDVIEFTLTYNTQSGCNMMKMDLKCHLLSDSAQAEHLLSRGPLEIVKLSNMHNAYIIMYIMNTTETYSRKKLLAKISLAFLFDCLYFTMWSFSEGQCK